MNVQSLATKVLMLSFAVVLISSCRSEGESQGPNESLPEMVSFIEHQQAVHRSMSDYGRRLLSEGGFVDRAATLKSLDPAVTADLPRWLEESEKMEDELEALLGILARGSLDALDMIAARSDVLRMRASGFASDTPGLESRAFIATALVVTAAGITVFSTFKKINEAVNGSQEIVKDMARGQPASRQAVVDALRKSGVSLSDGATAEDIARVFDEQDRSTRRRVTNDVRARAADLIMAGGSAGDEPTDLAVTDSQRRVDAAVELGEVAVQSVVAGTQAVTGGVGDLIGGTAGAATDLLLTATEMDPMSVVSRHVDIVVTSKDTENVSHPPAAEVDVEGAKEKLEQVALGGDGPGPDVLIDAVHAIWAEGLRLASQLSSITRLPSRIAYTEATLEDTESGDDGAVSAAIAEVPGFSQGEAAEVLVTRSGMTPQEEASHELGPDNALVLDAPPLMGTLSVEAHPAGPPGGDYQEFDLVVTIVRVPALTSLVCGGTNVVPLQRNVAVPAQGEYTCRVQVHGSGRARVRRIDSGESYLLSIFADTAEVSEPDDDAACLEAKAHLCMNLPNVGCDIEVMDRARSRVIDACGYDEAQAFFAEAPSICC